MTILFFYLSDPRPLPSPPAREDLNTPRNLLSLFDSDAEEDSNATLDLLNWLKVIEEEVQDDIAWQGQFSNFEANQVNDGTEQPTGEEKEGEGEDDITEPLLPPLGVSPTPTQGGGDATGLLSSGSSFAAKVKQTLTSPRNFLPSPRNLLGAVADAVTGSLAPNLTTGAVSDADTGAVAPSLGTAWSETGRHSARLKLKN